MRNIKELFYKFLVIRILLFPIYYVRVLARKLIYNIKISTVNNIRDMLCGDPLLEVKEFGGVFLLDSRSHIFERLVMYGEYEPELVKYCTLLIDKNRDAIDVGANIGFFTVFFAKILNNGQKVLSLEPTKGALRRLHENIELNHVGNKVVLFEGVATNKKGNVEIKTILGKEEYSSMGEMAHKSISGEKYSVESVNGLTIDELIDINKLDPGFIKVDVEGSEHLVFAGAQKMFKNNRPIILSELNDSLLKKNGSSAKEVIDMIRKFNYTIVDPIDHKIALGKKEYGDILCIPNEIRNKYNEIF